ncbi:MAG: hypothetical protein ABSH34_22755 [Verrucomicrobiota bacterium]|jgi:hypothetical protein
MKTEHDRNLIAKLTRMKEQLGVFGQPESRAALLKSVDDLIASLGLLRNELGNPLLEANAAQVRTPLEEVIRFLERAKSDETLQRLLSLAWIAAAPKPKRQPVEIASDLRNDEIRALLGNDLSKSELKAIAAQRAISVGESNSATIRRAILKNLDRQEGYERLASPLTRGANESATSPSSSS